MKHVTIYTDGACAGNPGPGGWAAVLLCNNEKKAISGGEKLTTNNKMELQAVIEALSLLKESCQVTLITDSKYVKDGAEQWLAGWKRNNWKKADKKPVLNQEYWQSLDELINRHTITWQWVKGHSGDEYNEMVDYLACQERDMKK